MPNASCSPKRGPALDVAISDAQAALHMGTASYIDYSAPSTHGRQQHMCEQKGAQMVDLDVNIFVRAVSRSVHDTCI